MRTPEVIFLDAGGTMTFPSPPEVAELVGVAELAEDDFFEAFYRTIRAIDEQGSPVDGRWWWTRWLEEAGLGIDALDRIFEAKLSWVHRRDGVIETLEGLRDAGLRMAVISNASGRVAWELEQIGVARFFETIVDSQVVGVEKPDAGIFEIAMERMNVEPSNAMHVGDVFCIDVVGARRVGITPVHLDPLGLYDHDELRIAHLTELLELLRTGDARS